MPGPDDPAGILQLANGNDDEPPFGVIWAFTDPAAPSFVHREWKCIACCAGKNKYPWCGVHWEGHSTSEARKKNEQWLRTDSNWLRSWTRQHLVPNIEAQNKLAELAREGHLPAVGGAHDACPARGSSLLALSPEEAQERVRQLVIGGAASGGPAPGTPGATPKSSRLTSSSSQLTSSSPAELRNFTFVRSNIDRLRQEHMPAVGRAIKHVSAQYTAACDNLDNAEAELDNAEAKHRNAVTQLDNVEGTLKLLKHALAQLKPEQSDARSRSRSPRSRRRPKGSVHR